MNAPDDATDSPPSNREWRRWRRELERQATFGLDWGLDRMTCALEESGHPSSSYPVVAIAGTHGKGSTAALLAAIAQAHGHRVGLFTSPHLVDVRERFRIDGRLASPEAVYRAGRPVIERHAEGGSGPVRLTYFELTTLIAARLFRNASIDLGIFEVGLGGRLDAVNALDLDLSAVTAIGYDHTDILGDTIESIATEKAGIVRSDAPVVIGEQPHDEAREVLLESDAGSQVVYGRDVEIDGRRVSRQDGDAIELPSTWSNVRRLNAATATEAAALHLDDAFDVERAERGLHGARWPGRMDRRALEPGALDSTLPVSLLFDTAHHPESIESLISTIRTRSIDIDAVLLGAMADKDLDGMAAPLAELAPVWGAALERDRAAGRSELEDAIPEDALVDVEPLERALRSAIRHTHRSGRPGRLLVTGSTFLVGACFELLDLPADALATYRSPPLEP
jgi:dihydrofolate synthase/folylpolyglutamate synthase